MHKVLVNRLGGLSLPRKSVVRLTDRPDMTLDVYRGCKTTTQQQQQIQLIWIIVGQRAYCACSRCKQGLFHPPSLFYLTVSGRQPDIDRNIVSNFFLDGSNDGSQICFYGEKWLIIPKSSQYPFISGALRAFCKLLHMVPNSDSLLKRAFKPKSCIKF